MQAQMRRLMTTRVFKNKEKTVKMKKIIGCIVVFSLAVLLGACGGGGGENSGGSQSATVLNGDSAQTASATLQDKRSSPVASRDIVRGYLLTRLFVAFKADATVGQVNAAAKLVGASSIAFSSKNSTMLTFEVPRQASIVAMSALAKKINAQPGVFVALPGREFKSSVLPEREPNVSVSPQDLKHLLPTRFPQAWNARNAAPADCSSKTVDVYVWDIFGADSSRPSFPNQFDSNNFFPDPNGVGPGDFDEAGHGYDVSLTLAAAFDSRLPTGANPFHDCLTIRQVEAFGYDMSEAIAHLLDSARNPASSPFIVQSSLNFPEMEDCGVNEDEICDDTTIKVTPLPSLYNAMWRRVMLAVLWAQALGPANVKEKMLMTQAAGNIDPAPNAFLARNYPGYRSAIFSSPASLATHLSELPDLLSDMTLWRNGADPTLPDLTFPADQIANLTAILNNTVGGASLNAENLLIVGSGTNPDSNLFAAVAPSDFNFYNADILAVGQDVVLDPLIVNGTSFAAPQAAGLASYMWLLSDTLRSNATAVSTTVSHIKQFSRTSANSPSIPLLDAYATIVSLDKLNVALGGPSRTIRKGMVDINGDGNFDHLDLLKFEEGYKLKDPNRPTIPTARDYSRFDLNGDGYTGGIVTQQFDLDASGGAPTEVSQTIEGVEINFVEAAVSDIQILCFYAYSDLYAASTKNHDEAITERANILGRDHCLGIRISAQLPAQITTAGTLSTKVENPNANGQFTPVANALVNFTPTCATVNPTSGRTDAGGNIQTTVTPNAGCTNVSVDVVASADVGTPPLAQTTVNAVTSSTPPTFIGTVTVVYSSTSTTLATGTNDIERQTIVSGTGTIHFDQSGTRTDGAAQFSQVEHYTETFSSGSAFDCEGFNTIDSTLIFALPNTVAREAFARMDDGQFKINAIISFSGSGTFNIRSIPTITVPCTSIPAPSPINFTDSQTHAFSIPIIISGALSGSMVTDRGSTTITWSFHEL